MMNKFFLAFIMFFCATSTFAITVDSAGVFIVGFVNIDTLYRYYNPNYHKNPNKIENQYDSPCERFITYMKKKNDSDIISFPMDIIIDSNACILFYHVAFARFFLSDKISNDTIKNLLRDSYTGEDKIFCWLSKNKKFKKQRFRQLVLKPNTFLLIRMTVKTWNEFGLSGIPKYALFYNDDNYADSYINVLVPVIHT